MNSRTASVFLVIVGLLLGGLVIGGPVAGAASLLSVFVTNDAAHPVPVREQNLDASGFVRVHEQGTANVAVQGTANVAVQGTPSVSIAGTPSVSIAGTPSVSVRNPESDRQPWRLTVSGATGASDPVTVPAGKLLAIENVALNGGALTPSWTVFVQDVGSGFGDTNILVVGTKLPSCEFAGEDCYVANEQVHVYATGGDRIFVDAENSIGYTMNLSGYLIDA